MKQSLYSQLVAIVGEPYVKEKEPMSRYTTFQVGGFADFLVLPETIDQMKAIIQLAKKEEIPYLLLGNGSNMLVSDKGVSGIVIRFQRFQKMEVNGEEITAQAGVSLALLGRTAWKHSLTGLEFAAGIPGTLGGAIRMNAGAYGGEMKDVVTEVKVLTEEGEVLDLPAKQLEFAYRKSIVEEKNYVVLEVKMQLKQGNADEIRNYMDQLSKQRKEKQPLEYASAGSTFKRPEGHFAGKLIQDAGLRGFSVGDAMVSEKHCGFVINRKNATAKDILELMKYVRQEVKDKFDVLLEPEVRFIGFSEDEIQAFQQLH